MPAKDSTENNSPSLAIFLTILVAVLLMIVLGAYLHNRKKSAAQVTIDVVEENPEQQTTQESVVETAP
jgi:hypothetical protein